MTNKKVHDSETLAEGKQIITVCAFIHQNFNGVEKVFLPKRALIKKFLPGVYELPGGHIDFGEELIDGLKREIKEEFDMNINVGDPFYAFTYKNDVKKSHSVEIIYFVVFSDPLEKIKINPEDHSEFGWFGEEEIKNVLSEKVRNDDPEAKAIYKAFSILTGSKLNF